MIRRAVAAVLLVLVIAHPAPAIAETGCGPRVGPFCAYVALDPSQVIDLRTR